MATFDLGDAVRLQRTVGVATAEAYARGKELLAGYEQLGYRVRFTEEAPPTRVVAEVSNRAGTKILASVDLSPSPRGSELELRLRGTVHVGGMKAMLASDGLVRSEAKKKLTAFIDAKFPAHEVYTPPAEPEAPQPAPADRPAPAGRPAPSAEAAAPPAADPREASAPGSLESKLTLIKDLHDRGLISEADFTAKKAELLERL